MQTDSDIPGDWLDALPVFPLPRLVFFPDTLLPLHIFEPRYRELTRWCLEHDAPLGVAMIAPGHEDNQLEDPPLVQCAGVGRIIHHQTLPDGCYNLVLEGDERVELGDEHVRELPFRRFECRRIDAQASDDLPGQLDRVHTLRACLTALQMQWGEAPEGLMKWLLESIHAEVLVNRVGSALFTDPMAQQALLEERSTLVRLNQCVERVSEVLGEAADGTLVH